MSAEQIQAFIQYYQRLTEHALHTLPPNCQQVFELNAKREIEPGKNKDPHA
jgi:D-glycerate 3-kinase